MTTSVASGVMSPCLSPRTGGATTGIPDQALAAAVHEALRRLALHSPAYTAVFANKLGVRLAGFISIGHVRSVTPSGREQMWIALRQLCAAASVEPGLDTNTLMDRVTGRAKR